MTVELANSYDSLFERALDCVSVDDLSGATDLFYRIVNRLSKLSPETLARQPERRNLLLAAHYFWTEIERWTSRLDRAIAVGEQLLAAHPDLDEINLWLGRLRIEQGQIEEGLTILHAAVERLNSAEGWNILGTQLYALGQTDQAEACYHKALMRATSNEDAVTVYKFLVEFYQAQHRVAEVLEAWDAACILAPEMADEASKLYRWLIEHGEIKQAQSLLQRERNPLWQKFYTGLIAWRTGQAEQARQQWQAVFVAQDAPLTEWMEAGLRLGHVAEVIEEFHRSVAPVDYVPLLMMGGLAYAIQGDVQLMHQHMQNSLRILKRRWPSVNKITGWWSLVTDLISDPETLTALGAYFEQNEDTV